MQVLVHASFYGEETSGVSEQWLQSKGCGIGHDLIPGTVKDANGAFYPGQILTVGKVVCHFFRKKKKGEAVFIYKTKHIIPIVYRGIGFVLNSYFQDQVDLSRLFGT